MRVPKIPKQWGIDMLPIIWKLSFGGKMWFRHSCCLGASTLLGRRIFQAKQVLQEKQGALGVQPQPQEELQAWNNPEALPLCCLDTD